MRHFLLCSFSGAMHVLGDKRLEDNEDESKWPALILLYLELFDLIPNRPIPCSVFQDP
jgi:hypothetical protein